ncbi:MAG: nucleotidyltransferase family protein [Rhodobacteraceae bacterium]|jgi:MurNAc alpha-1-phosphate uridylyltransferase|nr:nucleotidyltransferase family protein [Paracoccaceae bacterium]
MIFAAGFGTRMRHLTADLPKPLLRLGGRPLIDRALDLAAEAGAGPVVVNIHYLGARIAAHLRGRPVALSDESTRILETGGGLRKALPLLGPGPVMTLNPDVVWRGPNPLRLLAEAWDPARMDGLLLTLDRGRVRGRTGNADFRIDATGSLTRASGAEGVVYLGAQILVPDGLAQIADEVFSLNRLWDRMIAEGRLFGLPYPGQWCDVGSPEGLVEAEALLS